jgi:integrase
MVLLQAMFTLAIEWGEAQTNPVSVVRKPRQGRQRAIEPLAPEDIERLRAVLLHDGDHRSATLVSVLAYAGLRPGEALGLEWRHVRDRTLLIEQAVSDGRLKRQRPTASIARSTCSSRSRETSPTGRRRHARVRSSSHGLMASHGAPMTGTTGATATSAPRRTAPVSAVPGHTTFGTRSPRC